MVVIEVEYKDLPVDVTYFPVASEPEEKYKNKFGTDPYVAYKFRGKYWMPAPEYVPYLVRKYPCLTEKHVI